MRIDEDGFRDRASDGDFGVQIEIREAMVSRRRARRQDDAGQGECDYRRRQADVGHTRIVRRTVWYGFAAMIRLDDGIRRFNYRVAGVAIHDGCVLLHQAEGDSFWTLPGGRAEHGETAEETIRREMREELETDVDVVRLLWIVENFFEYDGLQHHEVALYFLIRFPEASLPRTSASFDRTTGGVRFRFTWHPVRSDLTQVPLFPEFLRQGLLHLPASVVHIVERAGVHG